MTEETRDEPHSSGLTETFLGARGGIAGTVYGTVVVMATLTVAYASEKSPWKLAVLVSTSAFVHWIAHRELGILIAAALPCAALVLGAIDIFDETIAVWLALAIGLATLAAEGVRYARIERLGRTATLVAIAGNLAVGFFVVLLKVLVAH